MRVSCEEIPLFFSLENQTDKIIVMKGSTNYLDSRMILKISLGSGLFEEGYLGKSKHPSKGAIISGEPTSSKC